MIFVFPLIEAFNTPVSSVRISKEWLFGDVINYFKFLDFKDNLKIGMSSIGKMCIVCALLHNALTCLYGNKTSSFFELEPPPPPRFPLGILCLEVEKNRTLYKTISNLPDCSCDYPWPVNILMLETKRRSNLLGITLRITKNGKGGFKCC